MSQPDLFTVETSDLVDYFEVNRCRGTVAPTTTTAAAPTQTVASSGGPRRRPKTPTAETLPRARASRIGQPVNQPVRIRSQPPPLLYTNNLKKGQWFLFFRRSKSRKIVNFFFITNFFLDFVELVSTRKFSKRNGFRLETAQSQLGWSDWSVCDRLAVRLTAGDADEMENLSPMVGIRSV